MASVEKPVIKDADAAGVSQNTNTNTNTGADDTKLNLEILPESDNAHASNDDTDTTSATDIFGTLDRKSTDTKPFLILTALFSFGRAYGALSCTFSAIYLYPEVQRVSDNGETSAFEKGDPYLLFLVFIAGMPVHCNWVIYMLEMTSHRLLGPYCDLFIPKALQIAMRGPVPAAIVYIQYGLLPFNEWRA